MARFEFRISDDLKEYVRKRSEEVYGESNISMYIKMLIKMDKDKHGKN